MSSENGGSVHSSEASDPSGENDGVSSESREISSRVSFGNRNDCGHEEPSQLLQLARKRLRRAAERDRERGGSRLPVK